VTTFNRGLTNLDRINRIFRIVITKNAVRY